MTTIGTTPSPVDPDSIAAALAVGGGIEAAITIAATRMQDHREALADSERRLRGAAQQAAIEQNEARREQADLERWTGFIQGGTTIAAAGVRACDAGSEIDAVIEGSGTIGSAVTDAEAKTHSRAADRYDLASQTHRDLAADARSESERAGAMADRVLDRMGKLAEKRHEQRMTIIRG